MDFIGSNISLFGSSSSNEEDLILLAVLLGAEEEEERKREKRRRRARSRLVGKRKPVCGERKAVMESEKLMDPQSFHAAYGMTRESFDELLVLLGPHLVKESTSFKNPIGVPERLAITLRYLATGIRQVQVARFFSVGKSTACLIIRDVSKVIWEILGPLFMARPTTEDWKRIAQDFNTRWDFPNCLGAVHGKHVQIQNPRLSGSSCYNYKRTSSAVLTAVADTAYKFIYLDVASCGSESESRVLSQSAFGKALEEGTLALPDPDGELPFVFVGDEAFPLTPHLMRPYSGDSLKEKEKIYNYRLGRAHSVVESAFSIMVNKWRILRQPIVANAETIDCIIKAIGVLHNFLREKEGQSEDFPVGDDYELPDVVDSQAGSVYSVDAEEVRALFVGHFTSPQGSILGQSDIVNEEQL